MQVDSNQAVDLVGLLDAQLKVACAEGAFGVDACGAFRFDRDGARVNRRLIQRAWSQRDDGKVTRRIFREVLVD